MRSYYVPGQRRAGRYPGPQDVDSARVVRAIGGDDVPLNTAELHAAIMALDGLPGLSATVIAMRLRVTQRTVERHRRRARTVAL